MVGHSVILAMLMLRTGVGDPGHEASCKATHCAPAREAEGFHDATLRRYLDECAVFQI